MFGKLTNQQPETQKQLTFEEKIEFSQGINHWHKRFNYQMFNLEELSCAFLNENEKFIFIKDMLHNFNKLLKSAQKEQKFIPNCPTKYTFYNSIMQLMRQAILTTNREVQSDFIDRVYNWVITEQGTYEKTGVKPHKIAEFTDTKIDKLDNSNFDGTLAATNDETKLLIEFDDPGMPSTQTNNQLKDFRCRARTQHKQYETPETRLLAYKRRQISTIVTKQQAPIQQLLNPTIIDKPATSKPKVVNRITEEESENLDHSVQSGEPNKNITLAPAMKAFLKDEVDSCNRNLNKSFEIRQNFQIYQSTGGDPELNLQQRWLMNRQKEVKQKKEDEEMVAVVNQWSKNKGRLDKEVERRIDSRNYGSRYTQCDFNKQRTPSEQPETEYYQYPADLQLSLDYRLVQLKQLPTIIQGQKKINDFSITNFEQRIAKTRVKNTQNIYKNLLNLSNAEVKDQENEDQQSMSVYATKYRSNSLHNKFSNLLQRYSPKKHCEESLNEIIDIKNRMAKYKIAVPMNTLKAAFMVPTWEREGDEKVPDAGQMLMSYEDPTQQKKGGKGRKKRK